jgi:hypothetical protein
MFTTHVASQNVAMPVFAGKAKDGATDTAALAEQRDEALRQQRRLERDLAAADFEAHCTAAIVELVQHALSAPNLKSAAARLVDDLRRHLGCQHVILGIVLPAGGPCRVLAISEPTEHRNHGEPWQAIEGALDEAVALGDDTLWPPDDRRPAHSRLAHQRLAEITAAGTIVSQVLRDGRGDTRAVWLLLGDRGWADSLATQRFLEAAKQHVGACLDVLQRAEPSRLLRTCTAVRSFVRLRKGQALLLALALCVATLFVPVPYWLTCDCELQPVLRRYVASPFDGRLEKTLVHAGDVVAANQLLATMDDRETRWELAATMADVHRAAKQRDGHLAAQEFGPAELSRYEVERLELRRQLLERRIQHLEIRSPIDGIVISGDLTAAEGMPLSVGQTLFEIGPLDELLVETAIPDEDVVAVSDGQPVTLVLDAFPGRRWSGQLSRIHPRSEVKNHRHVFVGEISLDNSEGLMRPGMRGQASIGSSSRALGWVLFHKPWETLRRWLAW